MTRGYIEFEFNGHARRIYGGSFFHAPDDDDFYTVNLMQEQPDLVSTDYFPIKDFSTPQSSSELIEVFEKMLEDEKQRDIYVGCFGGIGRTGLFIGSFLKYMGNDSPIYTTRSTYYHKAIETMEQENFVLSFPKRSSVINHIKKNH